MLEWFSNLSGWIKAPLYIWWIILAGMVLFGCVALVAFLFKAEKEYQLSSPKNKLKRYFVLDFTEDLVSGRLFYSGFIFAIILAFDSYLLANFLTGLLDYDFHEFFWLLLVLPIIYFASSLLTFVLGVFWIIIRNTIYLMGDLTNFLRSKGK